MIAEQELIRLVIEQNSILQSIGDFYPELLRHRSLEKLVELSRKWDKIFTDFLQEKTKQGWR